ncbi:hypothetical protein [Siphonobacter sp. SORGH_AS_1065]|nr:hypothetical protein [Siphonobacter sp. SORGH_AS_1065]MDQ1088669.1 hypothetical protein [Siphonobacter sp. SORGH_AS_1065]
MAFELQIRKSEGLFVGENHEGSYGTVIQSEAKNLGGGCGLTYH